MKTTASRKKTGCRRLHVDARAAGRGPGPEGHAFTPLPDIKVKPPGITTPPDVFNTVPLVVEQGCQVGALLCTCTDTAEEEEDGVDCVVPGRLDMVNDGFIRSCRNRTEMTTQIPHSSTCQAGPVVTNHTH